MSVYPKPLPRAEDTDNAPHWAAARAGELKVQRCGTCGRYRFPAAPICPACRSREVSWQAVDGQGSVESFCRFHKAYWPGFQAELPYAVVLVRLDCGVRLYSNLTGPAVAQPHIGMRVQAAFDPVTPEVTLVRFRAAGMAGGH